MSSFYEPGRYRVKVVAASLGESQGGTPQVELGIQILGRYDMTDGRYLPCDGPDQTVYLSMTENTMGTPANPGWVMQTLTDLGFKGNTFADLAPLVGQVRDGEMKMDEWEGRSFPKWSIYRARGSQPLRPLDRSKSRQLDTRFGNLLKAMRHEPKAVLDEPAPAPAPVAAPEQAEEKPRPKSRKKAAASANGDPDDIPF